MILSNGDKFIPGNRSWTKMPEGKYIIIRRDSTGEEMARFNSKYSMVEIGKTIEQETIYSIKRKETICQQ